MVRATVAAVAQATPTIKTFELALEAPTPFAAGQWLDVHIPGLETVGGFSLVSAPAQSLQRVQLAIKESAHPPARWMHRDAAVGAELVVRVGGNVKVSVALGLYLVFFFF